MGVSGHFPTAGALSPRERTYNTRWVGGWLEPGARPDILENIKLSSQEKNHDSLVVHPLALAHILSAE
jgi:hypothetical protein